MSNNLNLHEFEIDAEDVILLMLESNKRQFGKNKFRGVTRLEKLIFLLQSETHFKGIGDLFTFRAYNYGPFSKDVYDAINFLEGYELIEVKEIAKYSMSASEEENLLSHEINDDEEDDVFSSLVKEKYFSLTTVGDNLAKAIKKAITAIDPEDINRIDNIIKRYGTMNLNPLIKYVYKRYPEMTTRSIHPEANKNQHV